MPYKIKKIRLKYHREYGKTYRIENKEKIRKQQKKWEINNREKINKRKRNYNKTPNGLISVRYKAMLTNSKLRGHSTPSFSLLELKKWTLTNNGMLFKKLFINWKTSNYNKDLAPSFNRINDFLGYSFDNIELTTWKDNYTKGANCKKRKIASKNAGKKLGNITIQINKYGKIIQKFYSTREAERVTGINHSTIVGSCNSRYKTAGGFFWKYA